MKTATETTKTDFLDFRQVKLIRLNIFGTSVFGFYIMPFITAVFSTIVCIETSSVLERVVGSSIFPFDSPEN